MSRVLVIGAGRGQVPIIELCHKYGWEVLVVSPNGNYPGIEIADDVLFEDVKNLAPILQYAKEKKIGAVLTDQLDEGVTTAAYVAENMNLKGITYNIALKFTNKFIMRQEAEKLGINVPQCVTAENISELDNIDSVLRYPLMIKPVDSAASRGVYKVSSAEELRDKFEISKQYSKVGKVIVEEFIHGKEFVVDAFTKDYKVTNLIVGHRDYFDIEDTFIPNATVFVDADSAESETEQCLKVINRKLIEGFGLKFGITHAEYLYNKDENKIYLVEIAARGGGVFISSDLIPTACGVNANDLLVREVLGLPIEDNILLNKGASAYFCYLTPIGTVTTLNNTEKVSEIPGVHKAFFDNISYGMTTDSIKDKSSRKGPILVKGRTKDECYSIIETVKNTLKIRVNDGIKERDVIWN